MDCSSAFGILYRPLKPVFYGLFLSIARGGRIYVPQDELAEAALSEEDIFSRRVTDKWRRFLKKQIQRARKFFQEAEKGVTELNQASRWPVWTSLLLCHKILDEIDANDYDNFTKRAYVSKVIGLNRDWLGWVVCVGCCTGVAKYVGMGLVCGPICGPS